MNSATTHTGPLAPAGVNAAFVGVHDPVAQANFFATLGWETHRTAVIPVSEAQALWGVHREIAVTELRAAGAPEGRLVLLNLPGATGAPHPRQADLGLVAVNTYTRSLADSYTTLRAMGLSFRTPPASWSVRLGEKEIQVTQGFLLAPDGLDVVLVEPAAARGTAAWERDPGRQYTELTSVVCHVPDFEAEAAYWGPSGLGLSQWYDVTVTDPGLEAMAELPEGSRMRLSFFAGESTARVEVTRLDDPGVGTDLRGVQRTGHHLGHTGWLVQVRDLSEALRRTEMLGGHVHAVLDRGPAVIADGAPTARVDTPNQIPLTLVEVPVKSS